MRDRSSVSFPKGLIPRKGQAQRTLNTSVQELLYWGAPRGRVQSLSNKESTGEEHKAGFTIYKPMGETQEEAAI